MEHSTLPRNRYFEVLGALNRENRSDHKVGMLSELDMSSANRLRAREEVLDGVKSSYTALVARAIALALREHPHANRIASEWPFFKRIVQLASVHVSVAVERDKPGIEQAVFVGTIRDADSKDLAAITGDLRALAQATPENCPRWALMKRIVEKLPCWLARTVLSLPRWSARLWVEHRGGAAMISSPAKYGVDVMIGTWPWPLGFSFGLVKDRPVVVEGRVVVRPTMALTMSFDRRLMGGAPAARFFRTVCDCLEKAESRLGGAKPSTEPVSEPAELCGTAKN